MASVCDGWSDCLHSYICYSSNSHEKVVKYRRLNKMRFVTKFLYRPFEERVTNFLVHMYTCVSMGEY